MVLMMLPGAVRGSCSGTRCSPCLPAARRGGLCDFDLRAVTQPVDAINHHLVAPREPRGDHRVFAICRTHGDISLGDRRIVFEQIDEIARRAELDRRIGRERTRRRTLTNWFGNRTPLGLSNVERILIVPVVTSIWLSKVVSVPVAKA
jgi:hypothetical protein